MRRANRTGRQGRYGYGQGWRQAGIRFFRAALWALCLTLAAGWVQAGPAAGSEQCPSGPAASFTPSSPGTAGTFLLFSDVHLNPFAAPALVPALVAAPVEGWRDILAKGPAGFSPYGQDTNNALFQSFLDAMVAASPKPDFILFPGDLLCHHFWALYPKLSGDASQAGLEAFIQKTVEYFFSEVSRRFPGVPVYVALGNNDSTEGDYRIQPASPYLAATAQTLARMLPTEASRSDFLSTYSHYGCYAVTLPEAGGVRLVVVNDIFWSVKYPDAGLGEPVAAFLERELTASRARGEKVWLMTHIPLGDDTFKSAHKSSGQGTPRFEPLLVESQNNTFARLVMEFAPTITAAFAGHVHRDDFRSFSDAAGKPVGGMRLAPSISPVTGNNPGFQVYAYDREGPAILDETTYSLNLAAPAGGWRQEYVYSATYGRGLRGPADWQATYRDLGTCPPRRLAYGTNYDLGSAHVDDVTETTFPTYWRAMAAPTKSVWEVWSAPVELVR
ncbi:metallophosphoesterase [Solidesulfovibrio aerotolerans]|nr:metallophosphoesterase [Solidesulfovibrio aerotolerans]